MKYSTVTECVFTPLLFSTCAQQRISVNELESVSTYFCIWHVQVKVQVVVQGRRDARVAGAEEQKVAVMTGSAAGGVVTGAGGAGGG